MTAPWVTATITLTIPDNEARTAYSTLRRLGVDLAKLERLDLVAVATADAAALEQAVRQNEALFNENTHRLAMGTLQQPGAGELWVSDGRPQRVALAGFGEGIRLRAYRLRDVNGNACSESIVAAAAEMLLCNPAVQRRIANLDDVLAGEIIPR